MAREVPQYIQQLQMGSMPQVQFTNAREQMFNQAANVLGQVSENMMAQERQTEELRYSIAIDKGIREAAETSGNDANMFRNKVGGFSKGLLKDAPSRLREAMQLRIETKSAPHYERIGKINKEIRADQFKLDNLTAIRQAQDAIKDNITLMRSPDANSRLAGGRAAQLALQDVTAAYNARDEDGQFIFTPDQIDKGVNEAKDYLLSEDLRAWFKAQPNKLEAAEKWRNGQVNLTMPNANGAVGLEDMGLDATWQAMKQRESGGAQFAPDGTPLTSSAGAVGIAQVMPDTAPEAAKLAGLKWDESRYRTDATYNEALGKAYFKKQAEEFGSPALAAMAYNAGPGAVRDFMDGTNKTGKNANGLKLGDPTKGEVTMDEFISSFPYKETRDYVTAVASGTGLAVINTREAMSADAVAKMDNDITKEYMNELKLEDAMQRRESKRDKELAEFQYAEHLQRAQDNANPLTVDELDLYKGIYVSGGKSKEFFAMRSQIISGEPEVDDPVLKNQLLANAARGLDVTEIGLQGVQNGTIKMSTYNQALAIKNNASGPSSDILSFYTRQLQTSLMGVNKEMGPEMGTLLANATIEMTDAHNRFVEQNGRPPSLSEMRPIYEQIRKSSSVISGDFEVLGVKPSYINAGDVYDEKVTFDMMRQKVKDNYTNKYKNKIDELVASGLSRKDAVSSVLKSDPDFAADYQWLNKIKTYKVE